jgi:hypothetical protein
MHLAVIALCSYVAFMLIGIAAGAGIKQWWIRRR